MRSPVTLIGLLALSCSNFTEQTSNNAPNHDAGVSDAGANDLIAVQSPDASVAVGPGYLWYAGVQLDAFTRNQTTSSSTRGPAVVVAPNWAVYTFQDLAFDQSGNLWTIPTSGNQVLRFPGSELASGDRPSPDLILSSADLKGPESLVFDSKGSLWVVNFAGAGPSTANVVRFDDVIGRSGMLAAAAALRIGPGSDADSVGRFAQGSAIAFDRTGKLWLAAVANVLCLGNPMQMSGDVVAQPSAVISTGDAYSSIAFSPNGSLWITGTKSGYYAIRFDHPESLGGQVSTPSARLAIPAGEATFVGGLGFDAGGALWVATSARIVAVGAPDTLTGDSAATPTVALSLGTAVPGVGSKLLFR